MLHVLARYAAATRNMYQDKISQIKFYHSRYCSREWKTFDGKIEQKLLWSLVLLHMLQDLARYPAATGKMYQDKISQIKFYYSRYCSRKRKTFGGKINIAVAHPGTHASRSGKISLPPLAKCTRIRYHKLNSTTVGIAQESEKHLVAK